MTCIVKAIKFDNCLSICSEMFSGIFKRLFYNQCSFESIVTRQFDTKNSPAASSLTLIRPRFILAEIIAVFFVGVSKCPFQNCLEKEKFLNVHSFLSIVLQIFKEKRKNSENLSRKKKSSFKMSFSKGLKKDMSLQMSTPN